MSEISLKENVNSTNSLKQFQKFGVSGGYGGIKFEDRIPSNAVAVKGVKVWGGDYIDAIQFFWVDNRGNVIPGKKWGGSGGFLCIQLEVPDGEQISSIRGFYGDFIDSIQITRSDGYSVDCGGRGGSNKYDYTASSNQAIWGLHGKEGDFIDSIGVIIGSINR